MDNELVLAAGYYKEKAKRPLLRTAALMLKEGTDLRQIQQMLGYASITTMERHLEPIRSLQMTAGNFIQVGLVLTIQ